MQSANCQQEEKTGSGEKLSKEELNSPKVETELLPMGEREEVSNIGGNNEKLESNEEVVVFSADKNGDAEWTFWELAEQAKKSGGDMVALLKGRIPITEIVV